MTVQSDGSEDTITFTFQSGYIQIPRCMIYTSGTPTLHSNLVIFKYYAISKLFQNSLYFTFQSGYIQIAVKKE